MGWFYKKKMYRSKFTVKTLYLLKHVSELYFNQCQDGLHVHGDLKMGDKFTCAPHYHN